MRVFAYCCASFEETTWRAAGVEPLLSPPVTAETFEPRWLEGPGWSPAISRRVGQAGAWQSEAWELIYFDLHGWPGEACWRGDDGLVALTAE